MLEFSPDPEVEKKWPNWTFRSGDISWPEHVGDFTIPIDLLLN